jgi:hypothetical protein
MAEVISLVDVIRERRREKEREHLAACVRILDLNLQLVLHLFREGPPEERPVRARQLRQLSELLEYAVRDV